MNYDSRVVMFDRTRAFIKIDHWTCLLLRSISSLWMKSSVYLFPMTRTLDSNFDDDRHSSSELKPHSGGKSRRNEMFEHHEPKHFESFYKMD